jgi:hypothetical protein
MWLGVGMNLRPKSRTDRASSGTLMFERLYVKGESANIL